MRISVDDIFHHIAQELRSYSGNDPVAAVDEFLSGCVFDMHLCITTDVEESEQNYQERYGKGYCFYFRLDNYEHGRDLASDLYYVLRGVRPDMSSHTGEKFGLFDELYLFIHILNVLPMPVRLRPVAGAKAEMRTFLARM